MAGSFWKGAPYVLWMRQKRPTFGRTFSRARIAKVLGLKISDLDSRFPPMLVSTGLPFVIVPLGGLKAIRKIDLSYPLLRELLRETRTTVILIFTAETYSRENDLNVRVLGLPDEIPEDPATGSGNGCLAAYLIKTRYFGRGEIDVRGGAGVRGEPQVAAPASRRRDPAGHRCQRGGECPVRGERGVFALGPTGPSGLPAEVGITSDALSYRADGNPLVQIQ